MIYGLEPVFLANQFFRQPLKQSFGTVTSLSIDFGDGTAPVVVGALAFPVTTMHTYQSNGTFTIKVTATDSNGEMSLTITTVSINVEAHLFCDDGVLNFEESDVDCGGPDCADRCATGESCWLNTDCQIDNKCMGGVCVVSP